MSEKPIARVGTKPRTKASLKQRLFAEEFVRNKGNATQATLAVYDVKNAQVAQSVGSENLSKPIVRREIEALLIRSGIRVEDIFRVHNRNMVQDINLPTSQKAVSDFYDILGMKNTDKPTTDVKIAFIIEKD